MRLIQQVERYAVSVALKAQYSDTERDRFLEVSRSSVAKFERNWKLLTKIQHQQLNKCKMLAKDSDYIRIHNFVQKVPKRRSKQRISRFLECTIGIDVHQDIRYKSNVIRNCDKRESFDLCKASIKQIKTQRGSNALSSIKKISIRIKR